VRTGDSHSRMQEFRRALLLSFVPIGVAVVFGSLLLPRAALPDAVPLPIADARELARTRAADMDLAASTRTSPLAPNVRALGSALRAFHTAEAAGADTDSLAQARHVVEDALRDVLPRGETELLRLRAVELEIFLAEVQRFESSGVESTELDAVAGNFVRSMRAEHWIEGHSVLPKRDALRAMYKQMWNAFLGLEDRKPFEPSLDEVRALYAFYLLYPHPSAAAREAIASARRVPAAASRALALDDAERAAVEAWRLEKIGRLSVLDPFYPADFARGASNLRRGDSQAAAKALRDWLNAHPEGPLALRAQNYLRLAQNARDLD
jgi:hypothetical protein